MRNIVTLLVLLAASPNMMESNNDSDNNNCVMRTSDDNNHCINSSTCPTWFTCNTKNRCQCDNRQTYEIVCDNQAQISALSIFSILCSVSAAFTDFYGARTYVCVCTCACVHTCVCVCSHTCYLTSL